MKTCNILREPVPVMDVRVLDGHALRVHQDGAPTVTELYEAGETIVDLRVEQALPLIAVGAVEAV